MEKEKVQKIEVTNRPQFKFLDALTGPDILHPTHQVIETSIRMRRSSVEKFIKDQSGPLLLDFCDQFGASMQVPIMRLEFSETNNPNIINVHITGLFPIKEKYRLDQLTDPEDPMGY